MLAKSERDRATSLLAQHAISQEEYDTRTAGREQAQANVEAAQAALDAAALNLTFTRVTAPISGRISRALVTSGNFVTNGQTPLTTLVSLDPIYVSFDGDEQEYLKYIKLARDGTQPARARRAAPCWWGWPTRTAIRTRASWCSSTTRSIRRRAPSAAARCSTITTGSLHARVCSRASSCWAALSTTPCSSTTARSAPTRPCATCWCVVAGNKVEYRPVQLGPVVDGLRVVQSGLAPGETIVVNGLQRVRPGAQVAPQRVAMGERRAGEDAALLAHNTDRSG